jgi:hypothetical protein
MSTDALARAPPMRRPARVLGIPVVPEHRCERAFGEARPERVLAADGGEGALDFLRRLRPHQARRFPPVLEKDQRRPELHRE